MRSDLAESIGFGRVGPLLGVEPFVRGSQTYTIPARRVPLLARPAVFLLRSYGESALLGKQAMAPVALLGIGLLAGHDLHISYRFGEITID